MEFTENGKDETQSRISRRKVMQWIAASAGVGGAGGPAFAQSVTPGTTGYGTDPNLMAVHEPGGFWPLILSDSEKKTVTTLADIILPQDEFGPAASAVRVPDYINEWISAPYPRQESDREIIVPGLQWLGAYSQKKYGKDFADLPESQKIEICDQLASSDSAEPEIKKGSPFFDLFTEIAAGAYYSTTEGWKAIGYLGNAPSVTFEGPPPEVLAKVGVEQTVIEKG